MSFTIVQGKNGIVDGNLHHVAQLEHFFLEFIQIALQV